ncbi:MAG: hypothetical protein KGL36_02950 [Gammaproteobacteria bacterium]|nr:hypothetical protein [Gammaproteobacteria bacterium]
MIHAILAILVVVGALVGGLLTLRASTRLGMPSEDVIERAKQREHARRAREHDHGDGEDDGGEEP